MSEIVLQVPDDALQAQKMSLDELGKELRLAAAVLGLAPLSSRSSAASARNRITMRRCSGIAPRSARIANMHLRH